MIDKIKIKLYQQYYRLLTWLHDRLKNHRWKIVDKLTDLGGWI